LCCLHQDKKNIRLRARVGVGLGFGQQPVDAKIVQQTATGDGGSGFQEIPSFHFANLSDTCFDRDEPSVALRVRRVDAARVKRGKFRVKLL
jgi:hypothetical protein